MPKSKQLAQQLPAGQPAANLPERRPTLLLVSLLLFALWFAFLLLTALSG